MEFLGMIAIGVFGLAVCGRIFRLLFKLMGKGFDTLESSLLESGPKRKSTNRNRWIDDDDD